MKTIMASVGIAACIFMYFMFNDLWLNKLNHGTFTGKVEKQHISDFEFQTAEGDTISIYDFKGKIVVIDCWYTYCGVCYKKFPAVQIVYDKLKNNPEVVFFALHSRIERNENRKSKPETVETGLKILKKDGYTFPCYSIDIDNPKLEELGVDAYPTVLIFDRESNLIFRGSIENAERYIKKLIKQ
ncbi:MAG: TlpA family protein disulfide reductase [Paludibacter sp.]|nr:TlpA family protein disulfide reductase [Paludibacter sp.]